MDCSPELLPALRFGPVPIEASPEVADAAAGVPEGIVQARSIEHAGYPLPVVGRVVTDKDRAPASQMLPEPGREAFRDVVVGRDTRADNADGWVVRIRGRVE